MSTNVSMKDVLGEIRDQDNARLPRTFTKEEIEGSIDRAKIRDQVKSRLRYPTTEPPLDLSLMREQLRHKRRRLVVKFDCNKCGKRVQRVAKAWLRKRQDKTVLRGVSCPECGESHWMEIDLRKGIETR